MKKITKLIAVMLCSAMLVCTLSSGVSASDAGSGYVISNPYEGIDWSTINVYKTGLHSHTNASDGDCTLRESIERHCETGFDIVATTDHGTVNYSWAEGEPDALIHGVLSLVGRSEGDLDYLGTSGTFSDGISYKYVTENGDDYLVLSDGTRIMRVPYGIEQDAVSANAHVNSWFVDYHNNNITSYRDAISNVDSRGGVCVINHPGEYSKARYEIHSEDAYNESDFSYWYLINKWAALIERYPSCIGIDINSKGDARTRFDRILWDKLLTRFSANGENVFAICSSDAHQLDKIDTGFIYALMPTQTSADLETCLRSGHFFGASHCLGNPDELYEIADALDEFYGETEVGTRVRSTAEEMTEKVNAIERGEADADDDIGITYSVLDENGYYKGETEPMITGITTDDSRGTITLETENALIVRWISDGELICTTKADEAVFSLTENAGKIGNYVRAEVFGEGGMLYTQAFILNAAENAGKSSVTDKGFFDFGILDCLVGIFENWGDILTRMIKNIF